MSRNNSSGKSRILGFFVAFVILFMVVFGVGVFVGKGLNKDNFQTTRSFNESPPAPPAAEQGDELAEVEEAPAESQETPSEEEPLPESLAVEEEETEVDEVVIAEATPTPKPIETPAPRTQPPKTLAPRTPAPPPAPTQDLRAEQLAEIARSVAEEKRAAEAAKAKPTPKPAMPKVDAGGNYTVQIGSFQDQKQANSLAGALKAKGYPAFIKAMATPDNKYWYRVRVGTFRNVEDAKAYGDSLKKAESQVEIVFITVNN